VTHEFRPGQLRALIWLLVLVPLIPTGLMVRFMADTIRAEREAAFERLTAIYQQTLDNAEAGFARQVAEQAKVAPQTKVSARTAHTHFRTLLDRDVVVRIVDAEGRALTGATVPAKRAVAQKSLKSLGYPWTVQVFLLDDETLARGAQEQVRSYAIILLIVVLFVLTIAIAAAWTVSRQIELRELRTTAVATVAHELRTPLASMRMLLDTMLEGRVRDESQSREYLELLGRETERLSRLAEDFLTFSRLERGKQPLALEPVKPRVIADQAFEAIRPRLEAPGCAFSLDVPGDLPPILANRDALAGILSNLLDNALKYTGEQKHISLWARTAGDSVVFAVTDDGIGIDRAQLRQIFRPFHQVDDRLSRSGEGAGLGLAIVAQLVAAQRGKIRVDSRPGKGATFSVRIPRA
jgi:signal transduction histidine kinase